MTHVAPFNPKVGIIIQDTNLEIKVRSRTRVPNHDPFIIYCYFGWENIFCSWAAFISRKIYFESYQLAHSQRQRHAEVVLAKFMD